MMQERMMLDESMKEKQEEQGKLLQSFILMTKEGKYAPIDESSTPYARIAEERETIEITEEEYYYSIS
jgi:hypothetical protein